MPYQVFRIVSSFGALVWSLVLFPLVQFAGWAWLVVFVAFPLTSVGLLLARVFWTFDDLAGWPVIAIFSATATTVAVLGLETARSSWGWSLQRVKDFVREQVWIEAQLPRLQERTLRLAGTRLPWSEQRTYLKWEIESFKKALESLEKGGHAGRYQTEEELNEAFSRYGLRLKHGKLPWQ